MATLTAGATVFYVAPPPAGDDAYNGLSPASPKATLAAAITAANADDTISVANGTYTLAATVVVNKKLLIRGASGDRDAVIVDGNNAVRPFSVTASGTTLESLTITRGSFASIGGAGVSLGNVQDVVITNCVVANNVCSSYTGGIHLGNGAQAAIVDCLITNNTCVWGGGGIMLCGDTNTMAVVRRCTIAGNTGGTGGGVQVRTGRADFFDCDISRNVSGQGGAIQTIAGNLSNCTITDNVSAANPGGILLEGTANDAVMTNCLVAGNAGNGSYGGGVYASGSGNKLVVDCVISNNSTKGSCGGILWAGSTAGSLTVQHCKIVENYAPSRAAGFGVHSTSTVYGPFNLIDCEVARNRTAQYACIGQLGDGLVSGCTFTSNATWTATTYNSGGLDLGISKARETVLTNCVFVGNTNAYYGAAVRVLGTGTVSVTSCEFRGNSSIGYAGGVCIDQSAGAPAAVVDRCVITGNTADYGGGVYVKAGQLLLRNSLIAGNQTRYDGGGVRLAAMASIENCTIVANRIGLNRNGGGVHANTGMAALTNTIVYANYAATTLNNTYGVSDGDHCCTVPALTGSGNIPDAPQFVDAGAGVGLALMGAPFDFGLTKTSPCKDAGRNLAWPSEATDLAGNERLSNGVVDIGAYEYWPPPSLGTIITVR